MTNPAYGSGKGERRKKSKQIQSLRGDHLNQLKCVAGEGWVVGAFLAEETSQKHGMIRRECGYKENGMRRGRS